MKTKKKEKLLSRARGYWSEVFRRLAPEYEKLLENIGTHRPCPFPSHRNSKDGFKLFEDFNQSGGGLCNTCGASADGEKLLRRLKIWSYQECMVKVAACLDELEKEGVAKVEAPDQANLIDAEALAELESTMAMIEEDNGRISEYYIDRGLSEEVPPNVGLLRKKKYYDPVAKKTYHLDAAVAYVEMPDGDVRALHYTFLSGNSAGKAKVSAPKMFSKGLYPGALKGAAIYLGEPAETMGIAEGIETALSVQETTGTPMMVVPSNLMKYVELYQIVRELQIWADNDPSGVGQKAAEALAKHLVREGVTSYIMTPPVEGSDWLDILNNPDFGPEAIIRAQSNRKEYILDEEEAPYRKPLRREKEPPIPYPANALGPFLGGVAKALSEITQAPYALCAQSLLAAASLVAQGHADVVIDHRVSPLSCYCFTLGESGERKSTVDSFCLKPVREFETECRIALAAKKSDFSLQKEQYENKYKQYLNAEDEHEREELLASLGNPPVEPYGANIIAGDPTIEGLLQFMEREQPSVGLFSDEGGRIVGGHVMAKDAKLRMSAALSTFWDGKSLNSQRAKGCISIYGKRLAAHLMMQPGVAEKFLADGLLKEQGILSRVLITEPPSTIGTRKYRKTDQATMQVIEDYNQQLLAILRRGYIFKEGTDHELDPRQLSLADDAHEIFVDFYNDVELQQQEEGEYFDIRGFASKAPEHAARLAGVLTLIEDIDAPHIPKAKMEDGISLARYYLHEAKRQIGASSQDPILDLAQEVLEWMQKRGDYHALVEIYQSGPMGVRNAAIANEVLLVLEEHGWVQQAEKREINGKMRREVWQLVPDKDQD